MKWSGELKSRGVGHGGCERGYADKEDYSSPAPDFYAFKYMCRIIAKEGNDVTTVDLFGFFLQTKKEEPILLKLREALALLLVELNPKKWYEYLRRENGKWVTCALCGKGAYRTLSTTLLACKKLARYFIS